jgi:hypothetical protein
MLEPPLRETGHRAPIVDRPPRRLPYFGCFGAIVICPACAAVASLLGQNGAWQRGIPVFAITVIVATVSVNELFLWLKERECSRRRRIAIAMLIVIGASVGWMLARPAPDDAFFAFLERHPSAQRATRAVFALAGKEPDFDNRIVRATIARVLREADRKIGPASGPSKDERATEGP